MSMIVCIVSTAILILTLIMSIKDGNGGEYGAHGSEQG